MIQGNQILFNVLLVSFSVFQSFFFLKINGVCLYFYKQITFLHICVNRKLKQNERLQMMAQYQRKQFRCAKLVSLFPLNIQIPKNKQLILKIMFESSQQLQTKNILNSCQFNCIRKIGKGGFGHVLLVTKSTSSSGYYAVKCLSKKKMIKDPQLKKSLVQEINTMATLNHPNIVKLLKTFEEGDWYFLMMEYCDMGNLYAIQSKLSNKVFELDEAVNIFNQILKGVEVIHKHKIVHRDIKLENIFVRKVDKSSLVCKIGDFGLARFIEIAANSNCGTQNYMAPEILEQVPYGQQVDIWSLGVLLFYMLFGEFPFKGINMLNDIQAKCQGGFKLTKNIKNKNYFKIQKEEEIFSNLFQKMFETVSAKRISVFGLRQHAALNRKTVEEESISTSTEEDISSQNALAIEWEINQITFIQRIIADVVKRGFLSEFLQTGFKFYVNKVLLYFMNKDPIKKYRKNKEAQPKLLKILNALEIEIGENLEKSLQQIKEIKARKENTHNFEEGLNTNYQDFTKFKVSYRDMVGKVYEQVHRRFPQNTYERAALKLKVFLCHIINRVFVGNLNAILFPHFVNWMKKKGLKITKCYEFHGIEEWIKEESAENLNKSQQVINNAFYK